MVIKLGLFTAVGVLMFGLYIEDIYFPTIF